MPTDGLAGAELETYTRLAIRDHALETQRRFTEYLIEKAGGSVTVNTFDTDAVVDVLMRLSDAGFVVDESKDGYAPAQIFVSPTEFHAFRDDIEVYMRIADSPEIPYHGSEIHADATLDEGTGIAIHPAAVTPTRPGETERPYMVRDPDGVLTVLSLYTP